MTNPLSYFDEILGHDSLNLKMISDEFKNVRNYNSDFDAIIYKLKHPKTIKAEDMRFSAIGDKLFPQEEYRLAYEHYLFSNLEYVTNQIFKRIERNAHLKESESGKKEYLKHKIDKEIPYLIGECNKIQDLKNSDPNQVNIVRHSLVKLADRIKTKFTEFFEGTNKLIRSFQWNHPEDLKNFYEICNGKIFLCSDKNFNDVFSGMLEGQMIKIKWIVKNEKNNSPAYSTLFNFYQTLNQKKIFDTNFNFTGANHRNLTNQFYNYLHKIYTKPNGGKISRTDFKGYFNYFKSHPNNKKIESVIIDFIKTRST